MDRKKIASLPHGKAEQTGRWARAYQVDETMVLDCYESRKYIGRYCMQKDGRYDFWDEKEGNWSKRKLSGAYRMEWYSNLNIRIDGDIELIRAYTDKDAQIKHVENDINYRETMYRERKREAAMERKRERIEREVGAIPALPEGFYGWLNETVFEGREYLFRDTENIWKCTACGKTHTSKKPYKQGQKIRCSRTGREVTVENRRKVIAKREPVMIVQSACEEYSAARHFVAERTWSGEGSRTEAYENVVYLLQKGAREAAIDRMNTNQPKRKRWGVKWYYGQISQADEFEQEWWDSNPGNKRCNKEYCYPEGIREALEDTDYENLRLETFARLGWKLQYNKMMIYADSCGFMEYLAKAGCRELTEELSDQFSVWGGFYVRGIRTGGKNASEVLGIDMQRFHRLRQADGGTIYLSWLKWEQDHHRSLPEQTIRWMDQNKIYPEYIEFISDRMSPVQVANYLQKQAEEYKRKPAGMLTEWRDYLSMAKRMDMDVNDAIVYRAKHLLNRHDELVEMLVQEDEDKRAEQIRAQYPNIEKNLEEIRERYEFADDDYQIIVPRGIGDILREGQTLHHCVSASDRYFERIENKETYVVFLRRASRPLKSWYTLEVEPGGTIRQKRTEYNRQDELEEVKKFLTKWQEELKKRITEKDRELAARSRTIRLMEMKELREKDERFAKVLEADLMEAM